LYRTVAGIDYAAPGGRRLRLAPSPDPALEWASARHLSPYGWIGSGWRWLPGGALLVEVEIPVGTTAEIHLPDGSAEERGSGSYRFTTHPTHVTKGLEGG
ncbi:MAG: alpha-L-rhamnosidase, partial [Actinomycetota bacterium]|nr:alpha-L-rhamnosidase [Actinomycetota bacterium]